jgi:hypothetical protein
MQVNGYVIKDKIDELKERSAKLKAKLEASNLYFASEGDPKVNPVTVAGEYATVLDALCELSYLQCWYNTNVSTSRGDTLHKAIKMQGMYTAMKNSWSAIANQATPQYSGIYSSAIKNKKDDFEYAKSQLDSDACNVFADTYSKNVRDSRAEIRLANAQTIEAPGESAKWEKIFSV